jgi:predicted metal-dependent peptidase
LLKDAGFSLPPGVLYNKKYKDMTAEAVYTILEQKIKSYLYGESDGDGEETLESDNNPFGWKFGEVKEYTGKDPQTNDHEWTARIQQAAQAAHSCGKGSPFMDRLAEANKRSRIPWREVCQRFVQVRAKNDYDWRIPNKRYAGNGIYTPCLRSFEMGKVLFIGDSSGSIGEEEINIAASEIQAATILVKAEFWVMWVDDHVQGEPEEIDSNVYPLKLKPKGFGGTDFKPGFEWIDKESFDPVCVIYITDGFCNSFPPEPDFPVLWLITSKENFKPPWGEVTNYWDI